MLNEFYSYSTVLLVEPAAALPTRTFKKAHVNVRVVPLPSIPVTDLVSTECRVSPADFVYLQSRCP